MPENTVSVARPGPLGNPFIVGEHGTREECVRLYRLMLGGYLCLSNGPEVKEQQAAVDAVVKQLPALRGKSLACWCRDDGKPCHADVLLELANKGDSASYADLKSAALDLVLAVQATLLTEDAILLSFPLEKIERLLPMLAPEAPGKTGI
jgi:hypothetical protein